MKFISNKLDLITVLAVLIFAFSLTMMSFDDFSWAVNNKSYAGFVIFVVLLIIKFANQGVSSKSN